ncbi:hypothetical protein QF035_009243 [Streptomyces umbrinus]|uniref:Uncharacterized protein n=1 Tax=Streptomyces umbrinus TaxID=67370 RepID=A0ABU0T9M5_9ACTN|nr:hypothetical protein [Streptomyces umbrinus]
MESSDVPARDDHPEVIPSEVDPDVECVRIDRTDDRAGPPPSPDLPEEGSGPPSAPAVEGRRLCPEGYLPRRRHRDYTLDGKRVVSDSPPIPNPDDPPVRRPRP